LLKEVRTCKLLQEHRPSVVAIYQPNNRFMQPISVLPFYDLTQLRLQTLRPVKTAPNTL